MFEFLRNLVFNSYRCSYEPIYGYILGILLCVGGIISYIPQYRSLIRKGNSEGINEFSLLLLNISSAFLAINSFVLNYWRFECYKFCSFWLCSGNLLAFWQILTGWIIVIPLYVLFIRYKVKESQQRVFNDIIYGFTYLLILILIVVIGTAEKLLYVDTNEFFKTSAWILGVLSALISSIAWIPQIYQLIKTKSKGGLSLLMLILQTPGNLMIIALQILYHQNWTTWITYAVILIEQTIIVILLIIYKKKEVEINYDRYFVNPTIENEL